MISTLDKTLKILEKLNSQLKSRILSKEQIINEKNYISDLPEVVEEMNNLLNKLEDVTFKDPEKVLDLLVGLHIKFGNYSSRIEVVHELLQNMIAHYEEYIPEAKRLK